MIDASGYACLSGTIEIAQIKVVNPTGALSRLDIDELDIVLLSHATPVDSTLIVGDIDALLLGNSMGNLDTHLCYARQRPVWNRCRWQLIWHRQGIYGIDCIALLSAFLVGKSSQSRNENGKEKQVTERHHAVTLRGNQIRSSGS